MASNHTATHTANLTELLEAEDQLETEKRSKRMADLGMIDNDTDRQTAGREKSLARAQARRQAAMAKLTDEEFDSYIKHQKASQ